MYNIYIYINYHGRSRTSNFEVLRPKTCVTKESSWEREGSVTRIHKWNYIAALRYQDFYLEASSSWGINLETTQEIWLPCSNPTIKKKKSTMLSWSQWLHVFSHMRFFGNKHLPRCTSSRNPQWPSLINQPRFIDPTWDDLIVSKMCNGCEKSIKVLKLQWVSEFPTQI